MSVTFSATQSAVVGFRAVCVEGHQGEAFATYQELEPLLYALNGRTEELATLPDCDDECREYGFYSQAITADEESSELNVSNGNAVDILAALGFTGEFHDICCGTEDAESFMGRILMALAVAPEDEGKLSRELLPAEAMTAAVPADLAGLESMAPLNLQEERRGPRIIMCGREAGYLQDKLTAIRGIAEFAIANGRQITWG